MRFIDFFNEGRRPYEWLYGLDLKLVQVLEGMPEELPLHNVRLDDHQGSSAEGKEYPQQSHLFIYHSRYSYSLCSLLLNQLNLASVEGILCYKKRIKELSTIRGQSRIRLIVDICEYCVGAKGAKEEGPLGAKVDSRKFARGDCTSSRCRLQVDAGTNVEPIKFIRLKSYIDQSKYIKAFF